MPFRGFSRKQAVRRFAPLVLQKRYAIINALAVAATTQTDITLASVAVATVGVTDVDIGNKIRSIYLQFSCVKSVAEGAPIRVIVYKNTTALGDAVATAYDDKPWRDQIFFVADYMASTIAAGHPQIITARLKVPVRFQKMMSGDKIRLGVVSPGGTGTYSITGVAAYMVSS